MKTREELLKEAEGLAAEKHWDRDFALAVICSDLRVQGKLEEFETCMNALEGSLKEKENKLL